MGIHYDYKSTKGNKLMEKQAKREKKLAEKKAKREAKEIHNTYNIYYTREQQRHYTKNLKNITKKKGRRTDRESFDNTPPRRLRRTFLYIRRRFRTPSRFDTVRCGL